MNNPMPPKRPPGQLLELLRRQIQKNEDQLARIAKHLHGPDERVGKD